MGKLRATLQSGAFKSQEHMVERLLEEGFTSVDIVSALLHHLQGGDTAPSTKPPSRPAVAEAPLAAPSTGSGRAPVVAAKPSPPREPAHPKHSGQPRPHREQPVVRPQRLPNPSPGPGSRPIQNLNLSPRPQQPSRLAAPKPTVPKAKPSTSSADFARLHLNLGAGMGIVAGDVVGAILGETGLPAQSVGTVDVRERHIFVDVISEHVHSILAKLNRTRIKGHKLKAKVA
jgi:ATP-dependent RNA helicase DeaD